MKADEIKVIHKDKYTTTIELPRVYSGAEVMAAIRLKESPCIVCRFSEHARCHRCKDYSEWQLHVPEQRTISLEGLK